MTAPHRSARGRRSNEQARATRAALVDVADELFGDKGYLETSIRDIARHAHVTSGALYGHFRNKADLLAEAINTRIATELEADAASAGWRADHVETLTRAARDAPKRRRLRALLVQGAAAAQTDDETRCSLRDQQLSHIRKWIEGYERERTRLKIDASVNIETAVLYTWAVELGLGMLESFGIEPPSTQAWADIQNRMARSLQLAPARHAPERPPQRQNPAGKSSRPSQASPA